MIAYSIMMLSIVDLFFFHAVCILNMLLCTVFFWIFFTISYVFDTIFAMDIPHLFSLLHSVLFFPLYQPPSLSLCMVFDSISSNIDEVLSINPSANLFIFGDFNAHHKDWLVYSGGLIDLVNSAIFFLSQTTLLRCLILLQGSQTLILTVLVF